jgi:hypothetical protein
VSLSFRHADDPGPIKSAALHRWPGVYFHGNLKDAVEARRTDIGGTPAGLVACVGQQLATCELHDDGVLVKSTKVLVPEYFREQCRVYNMPAALFLWHRPDGSVAGVIVFEDDDEAVKFAAEAFRARAALRGENL